MQAVLAIIGGTGLDNPEIMKSRREVVDLDTPWGTSSSIFYGEVDGHLVYVQSRHGKDHNKTPSQGIYIKIRVMTL